MKHLPLLTLAATLGLLALHPSVVRAQTEHPYTLTEGSYQGSFVRPAAAAGSVPERGDVRLELEPSALNVRILTRSPLARLDFELFKSFGSRLLFGMSLPTLRDDLARIYEPRAPSPTQRLATLKAAREAGVNVYVAMAPTYPECDRDDLAATLRAVSKLEPVTIFHEPINVRAENVARIRAQAKKLGVALRTEVFNSPASWQAYAREALVEVQKLAIEQGLKQKWHAWPDKALGSQTTLGAVPDAERWRGWLEKQWGRVSAWPS